MPEFKTNNSFVLFCFNWKGSKNFFQLLLLFCEKTALGEGRDQVTQAIHSFSEPLFNSTSLPGLVSVPGSGAVESLV